jgi:hypothetical protein
MEDLTNKSCNVTSRATPGLDERQKRIRGASHVPHAARGPRVACARCQAIKLARPSNRRAQQTRTTFSSLPAPRCCVCASASLKQTLEGQGFGPAARVSSNSTHPSQNPSAHASHPSRNPQSWPFPCGEEAPASIGPARRSAAALDSDLDSVGVRGGR